MRVSLPPHKGNPDVSVMESPYKRQRLSGYGDTDADLLRKRAQNDRRLKSIFESIFEKYGRNFEGIGDEIDLKTGNIVIDNGHILGMRHEKDAGDDDKVPFVAEEFCDSSEDDASDCRSESLDNVDSVVSSPGAEDLLGPHHDSEYCDLSEVSNEPLAGVGTTALAPPEPADAAEHEKDEDDVYDDELGDGTPQKPCFAFKNSPRHDLWHLPDQNILSEQEKVVDPKWDTPTFPTSASRHRPFHRRIMLSGLLRMGIAGTNLSDLGSSASIWAEKPRRRPRSYDTQDLKRTGSSVFTIDSDPHGPFTGWTAANERTLEYFKEHTQLTFKEIVKYFPKQTEQSLALLWKKSQYQNHNQEPDSARRRSPTTMAQSTDQTDCVNGGEYSMIEHPEPHYIVSRETASQIIPGGVLETSPCRTTPSNSIENSITGSQLSNQKKLNHISCAPCVGPLFKQIRGLRTEKPSCLDSTGADDSKRRGISVSQLDHCMVKAVPHDKASPVERQHQSAEEQQTPTYRLEEVPDSDSPLTSSSPLAATQVRLAALAQEPPPRVSPSIHRTIPVSEGLQPMESRTRLAGRIEDHLTLAESLCLSAPIAPCLPDEDERSVPKSSATATEHAIHGSVVIIPGEHPPKPNLELLEQQSRLRGAESVAMRQQVRVVVPHRKQGSWIKRVSINEHVTLKEPAEVLRSPASDAVSWASSNKDGPPIDHSIRQSAATEIADSQSTLKPSIEVLGGSSTATSSAMSSSFNTNDLPNWAPAREIEAAEVADSQKVQETSFEEDATTPRRSNMVPRADKIRQRPAASVSPYERTQRKNPIPSDSQTDSIIRFGDQKVDTPSQTSISTEDLKQRSNVPTIDLCSFEGDDDTEDDLTALFSRTDSRTLRKPLIPRCRPQVMSLSDLIDCSDDELGS